MCGTVYVYGVCCRVRGRCVVPCTCMAYDIMYVYGVWYHRACGIVYCTVCVTMYVYDVCYDVRVRHIVPCTCTVCGTVYVYGVWHRVRVITGHRVWYQFCMRAYLRMGRVSNSVYAYMGASWKLSNSVWLLCYCRTAYLFMTIIIINNHLSFRRLERAILYW